jgi:hypothetical protein
MFIDICDLWQPIAADLAREIRVRLQNSLLFTISPTDFAGEFSARGINKGGSASRAASRRPERIDAAVATPKTTC